MASKSKPPGAGDAEGSENVLFDSLNNSENNLDTLRAQYLAEIFALPPCTATMIAELAFGESSQ